MFQLASRQGWCLSGLANAGGVTAGRDGRLDKQATTWTPTPGTHTGYPWLQACAEVKLHLDPY